eukprot:CAMPEP_0194299064 /NCGR_PEP_ID=MMETSP0169-20130528/60514_1 /TAXON_ID=218684 /ORGANISM="Corethron pennatum, Strain L29A3" /LENGTH=1780 /DNA_ID=CAMNT_0039049125 /DNA_START=26 /DNA_END=5365 /DNA_ORIENTATION=+
MGNTGMDSVPPEHVVKKTGAPARGSTSDDYEQLTTALRTEEKAVGPPAAIPTEGDTPAIPEQGATLRSRVLGKSKANPSGVNSLLNSTVVADVPSTLQEETNLADATAFVRSMKEGIRGEKKQKPVTPKESKNLEEIVSDSFGGSRKVEKKLSLTKDETSKDNAEKPSKVEGTKNDDKQEISLVNNDEVRPPEKEVKGISSERKEGKNETTPGQTGKKRDLKRKRVADTNFGKTFLKVTDEPAIGTKALDGASVEKTIGGKDNSSPTQAPKESDKANVKKKFTEEKGNGPPMQLQKYANAGSVKRITRRSAVSGNDGGKNSTKSPGRPAKGRRRGSKAGTKAAVDGKEGHCGKPFLKVAVGPAIGTKPPPQARKESDKANTIKTNTEGKGDGPPVQLQKETDVGSVKRNTRQSAVSGDDGVKKNIKSPGRPAKGRRRGSKAGTKSALDALDGLDVGKGDCRKPFLKVTGGPAIALDDVSVENTTGGKVNEPPPHVPKELYKANVKKKFTEGKDDGPLLPSPKETDTGSVKRNTRQSAVSGDDVVKKNIKSPGRPAKERNRGSKAETKGAVDGEDVVEADCGKAFLKVIDGPAIRTIAVEGASVENTTRVKDNTPPPQAPKESDKANVKTNYTEEKDDGPLLQSPKEADAGSVKRNKRHSAVSGAECGEENIKSPGQPAKGSRGSKAKTKGAVNGADVVEGDCGKPFLKVADGPAFGTMTLDGASVEDATGDKDNGLTPPQAPKESDKANDKKKFTEEKDGRPLLQSPKEADVGSVERNERQSAASDDDGGEEYIKSPGQPANGRRRGSKAETRGAVNGADVVEGLTSSDVTFSTKKCRNPFLKVTGGPAIGKKALNGAFVENTTGGKVDGFPPQARKESDEANATKNFTEEKDDGPLLPSLKEADAGSVKINTRQSAVSGDDGGEENIKSPGRPAKGRRGSKAGTKGVVDGEDVVEGDCGKPFLKVTGGPGIGTKALDGASVEKTAGGKDNGLTPPQVLKESDKATAKKKFTEEKDDGPPSSEEADVRSVERNKRQSAVSGDSSVKKIARSPGRPAKRSRGSKAGTKGAVDRADGKEGGCGKTFLKVIDEPAPGTKALDGASVENTVGEKDDTPPLQAPKKSDGGNAKKKFTEEKDNGPPMQSQTEADVGRVKRNKRQSTVSDGDDGKKIARSPGRPARGRKRGSKAGTKAAVDGADVVEGDCGKPLLKVADGSAMGTKALQGAFVENTTGGKVSGPTPPQAPKESDEANVYKKMTEWKSDGPPVRLQTEADVGSVKRSKRQSAVSEAEGGKKNIKSPGRPAKGRRGSKAGTKGAGDGANVVEGDTCAASLVNPVQGEASLYHTLTPETVPLFTETLGGKNCARVVLTVSCGNSFNNWSILRNVNGGMQIPFLIPFLFWKSSLMIETDWKRKENYAESSTLPLSNFLSKTAFDLIFGTEEEGDCLTPEGRVHVYITSSNSKQTNFLCRAFSVVPNCVVVLLQSQNFFLDSVLPYTGMGVDRLAAIRGAAKISGYPALVIDGGTAMTYTAADSSGKIIGGAIGAGVGLKLFALKHRTDALPEVDPSEVYKMVKNLVEKKQKIQFFAKSTKDAMIVDIVIELLNKLRSITSEWLSLVGCKGRKGGPGSLILSSKENVERNIYLTGGDGALFELLLNSQTDLGLASSNSAPEDHGSSVTLKFESKLIHYGMCDTIIEALAKKAKKDDEDIFLGKRVAKFFPVVDKEENCLFLGKVNEVISSRGRNDFHIFYDDLFEEIIRKEDLQESISLYKEYGEMETVKEW